MRREIALMATEESVGRRSVTKAVQSVMLGLVSPDYTLRRRRRDGLPPTDVLLYGAATISQDAIRPPRPAPRLTSTDRPLAVDC